MLLTIAIPTFNRPALLTKNLTEILRQIEDQPDVGIFIADDSDGQANREAIAYTLTQFPNPRLAYRINPRNLGIDRNIKNCIRSSDSDYVWLLGEDDLLTENAVTKVVTALRQFRPPFLFANYIYSDDRHTAFASSPVVDWPAGATLVSFDDFIQQSAWALGFIGGCVVNKQFWSSETAERFSGTYYSHVGGIIDACIGKQMCVMGDILVLNRAEDVNTFTWSQNTFEVYFSFHEMLTLSRLAEQPDLLKACRKSSSRLFGVFSLVWLAAKRADGIYDAESYKTYYATRNDRSRAWKIMAWLISVSPRAPLLFARRMQLRHRFSRTSL